MAQKFIIEEKINISCFTFNVDFFKIKLLQRMIQDNQRRRNNGRLRLRIRLRTLSIVPVPSINLPNTYLIESPRIPKNEIFF